MNNPLIYTDPEGEIYLDFSIGWSKQGGWSFSLGAGIGFRGGLSAGSSVGYESGNNSWSFNGTASYAGTYYTAGYNTKAGWTTGTGYGYSIQAGFFSVSIFSAGVSYSQYGGFSANAGWASYNQYGGFSVNPSFGVSYTADTGYLGAYDIEDQSYLYDYEDPISYDNYSAYEFMKANELTDSNTKWRNLYADGTLPDGYKHEDGSVVNGKGKKVLGTTYPGKKKYLFWGKQSFDIYLYKNAFQNPERLFLVIQHELVHVNLHYLGYHDDGQHEATAYMWSAKQAKAWNMYSLEKHWESVSKSYSRYIYPYPFSKRTSRPINPFRK